MSSICSTELKKFDTFDTEFIYLFIHDSRTTMTIVIIPFTPKSDQLQMSPSFSPEIYQYEELGL